MARRSQCSSAGDNPLDPNYLPPHYREEYRLAIDALVEEDLDGYYTFLQKADVVDFLSTPEIEYIQSSVQIPQKSHHPEHPEQYFLETGGDGSSDTYWPIHSDLDAPGLDLGWPQIHHFIGPTEVTTLVNPPEPDMPSIKDQARRLIKNAQQVVAVAMDMFTDVDMFADILNAAMRNVAVYIILDEQNAHHFVNMVSNCRVNLSSIQFLRVRTVSGITYHCRSGKSFKGQMMDCFLMTDCRAVLSGNYSFMWSFEKLHRCMAHLFLGQLVSTFDEEFRILFAQSQPLMYENVLLPKEEFSSLQKRQYPSERTSVYRDSRKFVSLDTGHPEEWRRHSYDEHMNVDWRIRPLKKQESLHGPSDMHRFPSQLSCMDPSFDQGSSRMPMMENPAFKRHSYAEGGHGRFSYPQQQGMPEPDNQGRQVLRGQQLYPGPGPGLDADYSGYDKLLSQDYPSAEQYSEPQEMQPPHNFDPVLNYLSSTRNVDFDRSSENLLPASDLPFSSSHPRRPSLGQPYACQTSPTPSNPTDQKQFFQEPNMDRKDPRVKRGLRNWRISSYLCAYDNSGDDDLPSAPDPVEEPSYPTQQTALGIDLSVSKIPNVREFKVPAVPRASQMPIYAKITAREQPKKWSDESNAVTTDTKRAPTPSDSSSPAEGGKTEEAEQKDPKTSILRREDSFRRKYNAATPRSSRLRSSLIFSSLEHQHSQESKTPLGQQDEEGDKNDAQQTKLPFVSQVLGQRRSAAREPFEWSRYIKSATVDDSATETCKQDNTQADDKDPSKEEISKDPSKKGEVQMSLIPPDVEQANSSPSLPRSKPSDVELPINVQPPKSLLAPPLCVDMSNPDNRLMFFKEMAAKRKAALAAEAEKKKDKAPVKPPTNLKGSDNVKVEESEPKETSEKMAKPKTVEAEKSKNTALMKPPADVTNNTTVEIKEPNLKDTSVKMAKSMFEGLLEKNDTIKNAEKTVSTKECESISLSSDASHRSSGLVKNDPSTSQRDEEKETRVSTESEETGLKNTQLETSLPVSGENDSPSVKTPEEPKLSKPAVKESSPIHPPTPTDASAANVPYHVQGTGESKRPSLDSTSQEFSSLTPSSVEVLPSSASAALDSKTPNSVSVQLDAGISSPPLPIEQHTGSDLSSSNPLIQNSFSDHILSDSGSQISPITPPSPSAPLSTPLETISSNVSAEDSTSTLTSIILSSNSDNTGTQESVKTSLQESSKPAEESSEKLIEFESTHIHLDPVCQLALSKTPSEVLSAPVKSDICHDTGAAVSEPNTSSLYSTTKKNSEEPCDPTQDVLASENSSVHYSVAKEAEVLGSSTGVKAEGAPPSLSPLLSESGLPKVSAVENSISKPDQSETATSTPNTADPPTEHASSEVSFPANPDMIPNASQSETNASPKDALTRAKPPSELTGFDIPAHAETVSCSYIMESVGSVLSPEAEKPGINLATMHSPSDPNCILQQSITDSHKTTMFPSTETSSPTELISEVPTEPDVPCRTPESVIPKGHTLETTAPTKNSKLDNQTEINKDPEFLDPGEKTPEDTVATDKVTQESISSEKTNDPAMQNNCSEPAEITSGEVVPSSPQSKQPNSTQSRYHSSTVNVLSSSNLRDDTKLLLEQISANSQSRNEATKEAPVTDDEKEDEADKIAKREKERRIGTSSKEQPKATQEREKLLERIQSMRKERKVYSRFEV